MRLLTRPAVPWASAERRWFSAFLPVAEAGYGGAIALRRLAHGLGLVRRQRVGVPVICVGNLAVGGTGKTPAVIAVCHRLREWGQRPAVVSRGYRGDKRSDEILRVSPTDTDWRTVGDEPVLIARTLADVPVFVGADRVETARRAIEETQPTVIVLDDGFQHWRLARDLDVVLLDGMEPFGNGHLLPRGPLREPIHALRRAGVVVLTKVNLAQEAGVWAQRLENRLHAPVVQAIHRPTRVWDLAAGAARPLTDLRGRRVVAVSGLAKNETFIGLLRSLGALVEAGLGFDDHQTYGPGEWAEIRRVLRESAAEVLITTAKDAVKWSAADVEGLSVWVLEIAFEVSIGAERFWRVVRQAVER
jgi:tetraacyldisaccharide 4'-kinase